MPQTKLQNFTKKNTNNYFANFANLVILCNFANLGPESDLREDAADLLRRERRGAGGAGRVGALVPDDRADVRVEAREAEGEPAAEKA